MDYTHQQESYKFMDVPLFPRLSKKTFVRSPWSVIPFLTAWRLVM